MRKAYFFKEKLLPTQYNLAQFFEKMGIFSAKCEDLAFFSDSNLENSDILNYLENKNALSMLLASKAYYPKTIVESIRPQPDKRIESLKSISPYAILKPAAQNNGLATRLVNLEEGGLLSLPSGFILQHYLKPDLIDDRKYSLRLLVMIDNQGQAFLYQKGYMNLAKDTYRHQFPVDKSIYLTNEHHGSYYQGNQRQLEDWSKKEYFYDKAKAIIHDLFLTFDERTHYFKQSNQEVKFSFWGFDFMLDDKNKVWLLEANHGPCFPKSVLHPLFTSLYHPFWTKLIQLIILPKLDYPQQKIPLINEDFITVYG